MSNHFTVHPLIAPIQSQHVVKKRNTFSFHPKRLELKILKLEVCGSILQ